MMPTDYVEHAKRTFAIAYQNGSPTIFRSSYEFGKWCAMVRHHYLTPNMFCRFIEDGTAEAMDLQAKERGSFGKETLEAMSIQDLKKLAVRFQASGAGDKATLVAVILEQIENGIEPVAAK